jgi:hypothetical protein
MPRRPVQRRRSGFPTLACWAVFVNLGAINWIAHNWTVNQLVHGEDATSARHVPMTPLRILKALGRL